jgi:hypothetical protein
MADLDVFGKLSRIFETHAFSKDQSDHELDDILEELEPLDPQSPYSGRSSPERGFQNKS